MIKSDLVQRIHQQNPHLHVRHVEGLVDAILDTIVAALTDGDRAEIRALMKTLPRVATEMALHVLVYNLTRVMNIVGVQPLMAAMRV